MADATDDVAMAAESPSGATGPGPSQTGSHAFEAQPLNFGLDYLDFLDPVQLALAWIIHPDYDDMVARPMHKAWNKARHQAEADGLVGAVAVEAGQNGNWPNFAAINLDWTIPTDLDSLASEYLAALAFHPDVTTIDQHNARIIFAARRNRILDPNYQSPSPSPSPEPHSHRSAPTASSLPHRWNFVPRLPPFAQAGENRLQPEPCTTSSVDPGRHDRESRAPDRPRLVRGGQLLSKWRMTAQEKQAKRDEYALEWDNQSTGLQPSQQNHQAEQSAMEIDQPEDHNSAQGEIGLSSCSVESLSEGDISSDDEPLAKRARRRSPQPGQPQPQPRAPSPPSPTLNRPSTSYSTYYTPHQPASLPTDQLLNQGSAWGTPSAARAPSFRQTPMQHSAATRPSSTLPPPQAQPRPSVPEHSPSVGPSLGWQGSSGLRSGGLAGLYAFNRPGRTGPASTGAILERPLVSSPPPVSPEGMRGPVGGAQPARPSASSIRAVADPAWAALEPPSSPPERVPTPPTKDPRKRPQPRPLIQPAAPPPPTYSPTPPPPGTPPAPPAPSPTPLGPARSPTPTPQPGFGPHDPVPSELSQQWSVLLVKFMDPDLDTKEVAYGLRGGERQNLPAPVVIQFVELWGRARDCLVGYEKVAEAGMVRQALNRVEVRWRHTTPRSKPKYLALEWADRSGPLPSFSWGEVNPGRAHELQRDIGRAASRLDSGPAASHALGRAPDRLSGPAPSVFVPAEVCASWHERMIYNLDPTSTRAEVAALIGRAGLPEPVALKLRRGPVDQRRQERIIAFAAWESAAAATVAERKAGGGLEGLEVRWRESDLTPVQRLQVKHTTGGQVDWAWDDVARRKVDEVRRLASEVEAGSGPAGPVVMRQWGARPAEGVERPASPESVAPELVVPRMVPSAICGTWQQIIIHNVDPKFDKQQIRDLLARLGVPAPLALKVRNTSQDEYRQYRIAVFIAYQEESSVEAALELVDCQAVRWMEPTLTPDRRLRARVSSASEGEWRWDEVDEEAVGQLHSPASANAVDLTTRGPSIRILACASPRTLDISPVDPQIVAGWSVLRIFQLDPKLNKAQAISLLSGDGRPKPVAVKFISTLDGVRSKAVVVCFAAYAGASAAREVKEGLDGVQVEWESGAQARLQVKPAESRGPDRWTEEMLVESDGEKFMGTEQLSTSNLLEPVGLRPDLPRARSPPPSPQDEERVPGLVADKWSIVAVFGLNPNSSREQIVDFVCGQNRAGSSLPTPVAVKLVQGVSQNTGRPRLQCFAAYDTPTAAEAATHGLDRVEIEGPDGKSKLSNAESAGDRQLDDWLERELVSRRSSEPERPTVPPAGPRRTLPWLTAPLPRAVSAGWTVLIVFGLDPAFDHDRDAAVAFLRRPRPSGLVLPTPAAIKFVATFSSRHGRDDLACFAAYAGAGAAAEARAGLEGARAHWSRGVGEVVRAKVAVVDGTEKWTEGSLVGRTRGREDGCEGERGRRRVRGEGGGGSDRSPSLASRLSPISPAFAKASNTLPVAPTRVWGASGGGQGDS